MTHDERASKWLGSEYDAWWADTDEHVDSLAEQFREVEREAQGQGITLAVQRAEKLREIVRAGDALRTLAVELGAGAHETGRHGLPAGALNTWDAATKGIER